MKNIRLTTWLWWKFWVFMGRLLHIMHRLDSWVRWQYSGALTQEVLRRQRTGT